MSDPGPLRPPAATDRPPVPTLESVTTIDADGSHVILHPAGAHGRFTRWRQIVAAILIIIYLSLPWIPVGSYPAVFLDLANRRFHLFGWTLAAQDMWLLFFLISGLGFSLFFVTALLGRVWCGWACPQTVFLEQVYRRIERWLEGDAPARRALDRAPWNAAKLFRRVAKHALFIVVSLVITHLFLAYFISLPELWAIMQSDPAEHWTAFGFVFISAGLLYFNFAWFREQLCIVICPYGRIQSALTDDHSLVIGYDDLRGEPRGKPGTAGAGDCIACNRCVQVCPTGIDIRHGLQLECIGCAACIDACDDVMTRLHRPRGLIRYDSLVGFGRGLTRWIRPRTIVYGILLLLGAGVAGSALSTVKPANFTVFRMSGAAYFVDRETVRNQFLVRILNKRATAATYTVSVETKEAGVKTSGFAAPVTLASMGEQVTPLVLLVERRHYTGPFHFTVRLRDAAGLSLAREIEFLGPDAELLRAEDHDKGIKR